MKQQILELERSTKRMYRFKAMDDDDVQAITDTIYIKQSAVGAAPKRIKITVEELD